MDTAFAVGEWVRISPATDTWMRGIRYGRVTKVGNKWVHVEGYTPLGKPFRVIRFSPSLLEVYHDEH